MQSELRFYRPDNRVLSSKGLFRLICQLTHTKKTVGEESLDVAQSMNRPTKMTAMGYEWIRSTPVTVSQTEANNASYRGYTLFF
jgi:hypothetical protein